MIKLLLLLSVAVAVVACGDLSPEEAASLAAKGYYQHLVAGEYEQFLQGKNGADALPDDYREQLLTACKQFVIQQRQAHGGISAVRVSNAVSDTTLHYTSVFLVLQYADSVSEEIVVPMVETGGRWRMK